MVLNSFHNYLLIIIFFLLLLMYHIATHNIALGSYNDVFNHLIKDLLMKDHLVKGLLFTSHGTMSIASIRDKTTSPIFEKH